MIIEWPMRTLLHVPDIVAEDSAVVAENHLWLFAVMFVVFCLV